MRQAQTWLPLWNCPHRTCNLQGRWYVLGVLVRSPLCKAAQGLHRNVCPLRSFGLSNAWKRRRRWGLEPYLQQSCRSVVGYQIAALDGEVQVYLGNLTQKFLLFVFRLLAWVVIGLAVSHQRSALLQDKVYLPAFGWVSIVLHTLLLLFGFLRLLLVVHPVVQVQIVGER